MWANVILERLRKRRLSSRTSTSSPRRLNGPRWRVCRETSARWGYDDDGGDDDDDDQVGTCGLVGVDNLLLLLPLMMMMMEGRRVVVVFWMATSGGGSGRTDGHL
jgi:hypothetical protein